MSEANASARPSLVGGRSEKPITVASLTARSILDSRGYPTVEVTMRLANGAQKLAEAPAGASTGAHQAVELRDHGRRFAGRGVEQAVRNVETEIADLVTGRPWSGLAELDVALAELDGSGNWSRLGANAVTGADFPTRRGRAAADRLRRGPVPADLRRGYSGGGSRRRDANGYRPRSASSSRSSGMMRRPAYPGPGPSQRAGPGSAGARWWSARRSTSADSATPIASATEVWDSRW